MNPQLSSQTPPAQPPPPPGAHGGTGMLARLLAVFIITTTGMCWIAVHATADSASAGVIPALSSGGPAAAAPTLAVPVAPTLAPATPALVRGPITLGATAGAMSPGATATPTTGTEVPVNNSPILFVIGVILIVLARATRHETRRTNWQYWP